MSEEAFSHLRGRVRPLTIGLSIGTRYGSAGCTLGAFIKDRDGQVGFLTSAIALGVEKNDEVVYQPSALDAGTLAFRDIVGHVKDFTVVNSEFQPNYVDAALIRLSEGIEAAGNNIPTVPVCEVAGRAFNDIAPGIEQLKPETRVAKVGRTSGYTEGAITAIGLSGLKIRSGKKEYSFSDVIQITSLSSEPFSMSGDAGAVIFTIPERQPIGLLFAAGGSGQNFVAFACRLDRILQVFNARLL